MWDKVKLGEFLKLEKNNLIAIEPHIEYVIAGVQNNGKGIVNKRTVFGSELTMKEYQLIYNNQLLWCKVDTKNGAFGITTNDNINSIVSKNMHLANINKSFIVVDYFKYILMSLKFYSVIDRMSLGTTNRKYLKYDGICEIEIPLPPLEEQKRIVEKLDAIKSRIDEAKRLREEAKRDVERVEESMLTKLLSENNDCQSTLITDIVEFGGKNVNAIDFQKTTYLSLADIESQSGRILRKQFAESLGVFGTSVSYDESSILFSKLRPYLNKVALPDFKGIGTTELVVLTLRTKKIIKEFLALYLRSRKIVSYLIENSSGTKMPRANMKKFKELRIPIPSLAKQKEIITTLKIISKFSTKTIIEQSKSEQELETLFPNVLEKAFRGEL